MKRQVVILFCFVAAVTSMTSCENNKTITCERLEYAGKQLSLLRDTAVAHGEIPRTIDPDGTTHWVDGTGFDWTEGFFPGTCWYLYEFTGDRSWSEAAEKLQSTYIKHAGLSYHDLGFIFNCSYGNGYRLTGKKEFLDVLQQAGNMLANRFNPTVGAIKSWDEDKGWQAGRGWMFPVIIDNMMNLELLFELTRLTGDKRYADVAVAHANTTLKNHFREDYSSYHVVDYDPATGEVRSKQTAQGFSNESSWARGQAWAVYGYTVCYRYTKDRKYLEAACRIADFIIHYPDMPQDNIPYWDYNAPNIPDAPRDASAAAITASALVELNGYADGKYLDYACALIDTLSSNQYRAKIGANNLFLLMHSVGSIPHNSEIDVPLNYADYYYVEALMRLSEASSAAGKQKG